METKETKPAAVGAENGRGYPPPDEQGEAFRFADFSIDRWLRVVPGGYLRGTRFGQPTGAGIPELIREQGMLRQVYLMDLALFIAAERVSTQVASALVRLAPDESSFVFLASQTLDEARHFESFANRFRELGLAPAQREKLAQDLLSPAYRGFLDLLLEMTAAGDFEAVIVGLNIILEGMAFPLYDYEMRYWRPFDPALVEIINGAFKDECRHVGFGEKHLAWRLSRDPLVRARVQRRIDDLSRKMRDVFKEFLAAFVGFYDLAVQEYPERCSGVEIIPGRRLLETSAEDQVRWLEHEIVLGHRKRLGRIGLECVL
ncbi:ferritin-like domain-containing protein [bacterium]|nr:ferritin-like domain-containing protein [bacterium]